MKRHRGVVGSMMLAGWVCLLTACREPAPMVSGAEQIAQGEVLYGQYCAACHEMEGGIGPLLKKEVLATRVSASALFSYIRRTMPYEAGNTLPEQHYWDITAYLLARHAFTDSTTVLDAETASALSLALDN